jgi:hypothetical protein
VLIAQPCRSFLLARSACDSWVHLGRDLLPPSQATARLFADEPLYKSKINDTFSRIAVKTTAKCCELEMRMSFGERKSKMRRIALINMPFANLGLPSIALTQLKAIAEEQLQGEVSIEILYLNHDFGRYAGRTFYDLCIAKIESAP